MNGAVKQINRALGQREFARSTQIIYQYLYDDLFDAYIKNSKSIISNSTTEEARRPRTRSTPRSSPACGSCLRSCPS